MTDDNDPTGMRHLLAGLKESGPMPADLNERIRASLADEQAARSGESAGDASDESSTFWRTMDDEGGRPLRPRRSGAPWILGAAAATVVALGVGGLMLRDSGGEDTLNIFDVIESVRFDYGSPPTQRRPKHFPTHTVSGRTLRTQECVFCQISPASCSTQPGRG